ncbi:MAG: conjugal transfer protein TraD [Xanthomonadaceae bacterium]|nr:conjugal transfer protein TraD [Xanthomonadaceae bacterium]
MSDLMHDQQLYRAAQRAAQREAKSLLKALRRAHAEKEKARRRQARRRTELGEAVLKAGCGDWPALEVVGALLDAVHRYGHSPTQRLALRQRAEVFLQIDAPAAPVYPRRPDAEEQTGLVAAMFENSE